MCENNVIARHRHTPVTLFGVPNYIISPPGEMVQMCASWEGRKLFSIYIKCKYANVCHMCCDPCIEFIMQVKFILREKGSPKRQSVVIVLFRHFET